MEPNAIDSIKWQARMLFRQYTNIAHNILQAVYSRSKVSAISGTDPICLLLEQLPELACGCCFHVPHSNTECMSPNMPEKCMFQHLNWTDSVLKQFLYSYCRERWPSSHSYTHKTCCKTFLMDSLYTSVF